MHTIQYMLLGCRLHLVGQGIEDGDNSTITELKQFTLNLEDHASLVGGRLHLEALVETLLPYARHIVSAQAREHKSANGKVSITPWHRGHRLRLWNENGSARNDVQLDDGELANMVRCLDAVIHDPRFQLDITAPPMEGLRERELLNRLPLKRRLAAPLGGLVLTMALVGLGFLVPVPERFRVTDSEEQQEGGAAVELTEEQSLPIELDTESIELNTVPIEVDTVPVEVVPDTDIPDP
ncbi:MAG: DUF4335 domain-containing protein [Synechococcus sp. SB0668_bin_15]|nr:DUF4335 domain-containing protein [Synechococcus sp. SB0668_bin_15]MXZ83750.1 DUF4335 domain-containing protein [Synechococcus sp. SB0666_bin_14]MYA90875.1 DUF4335 domain-containing protein [Synechococcus sp. SB0663_bin_10]MYC49515.1 DUF4335 domain-containing protein [Synechococcus sp. SB0662_bin_14]MYG46273.1 DUF4335 domain-containing protein [Synechococcus sp. SB0675_bin_6]MYJ59326.1 DUF4335 domain-containing protein [Synechococcus sp. SB0672_bin_6]MYK91446.1 DUF4335 domain-containing pr